MSEQILERPAAAPTPAVPKKRSSRMFLVVGASVIAGLILGGAFLLLRPPADPLADTFVPVPPAAAAGSEAGEVEADETAGDSEATTDGKSGGGDVAADADAVAEEGSTTPAKTTRVRLTSRDPFAPIVAKAPAPETAAPDAKAAEPAPAPKAASGGTISAVTISPLGNSVKLKLDGKKYTVDEGEAFAKSYRLYDIFNANCAGFLYGDQNAVVCEGDSVAIG
ncbi:MAG TPA: hypothetical protein VES19_14305 [Candidatus Limnocylindrales bacterium]|nr:hypothetical protein [Candidatus Limnocylindrales bacterium]